jgi:PST family polysaccharide transporter
MQVFYRVSGLVLLVAMSRLLSASEVGRFFFAVSFAEAFLLLANFSLNTVLMRQVAAERDEAGAHLAGLLGFRLLTAPAYLLIVIGAALLFSHQIWSLIAAIAVFTLIEDLYFVFGSMFLATERVDFAAWIGLIVEVPFMAALVIGLWRWPSVSMIVWANLLRSIALLVLSFWTVHRKICGVRFTWNAALVKSGLPFILMTLVSMIQTKISPLSLGLLGNYSAVGYYEMAMMLVLASVFVPSAIGSVVFPRLSAEGMTSTNRRLLLRAGTAVAALGVLGMLVVLAIASPLTRLLYGANGAQVASVLRCLSPYIPLNFVAFYLGLLLQAVHREKRVLRCLIIATIVTIAAHVVLIPRLGPYGAAIAQDLSVLLQSTLLILELLPLMRSDSSPNSASS